MSNKIQKTIDILWQKYATALKRLEWALDELDKKPKVQVDWYENTDKITFLQNQLDELKKEYNLAVERIEKQNNKIRQIREENKVEVKDHIGNTIEIYKPGEEPQPAPNKKLSNNDSTAVPPLQQQTNYQEQISIPDLSITAEENNSTNAGFGTKFPTNPVKGDIFLRVDYLPSKLYKWNEKKWIEVDKDGTDRYVYDEAYIKHLIEKLESGEYDPELLTTSEQEQISRYIIEHPKQ